MRSDEIRTTLQSRYDELTAEYETALAENHTLRLVETADTARRWPSGTPPVP